jgi:hypothetical protein
MKVRADERNYFYQRPCEATTLYLASESTPGVVIPVPVLIIIDCIMYHGSHTRCTERKLAYLEQRRLHKAAPPARTPRPTQTQSMAILGSTKTSGANVP